MNKTIETFMLNACKRLLLLSSFFFIGCAHASILVSPMVINFTSQTSNSKSVAVKNLGKSVQYVKITPFILKNAGSKKSVEKRIINPAQGLLVFPSKLTLSPGETQYLRIIATRPPAKSDQSYIVKFIPQISGLSLNKNINGKENIGLHFIIAYGVRVIIRPKVLSPKISVKKLHNKVVIKNTGNTSFVINTCYQYVKNKKHNLQLSCARVYPNKTCEARIVNQGPVHIQAQLINKSIMNKSI